jgi:hypothetical protein
MLKPLLQTTAAEIKLIGPFAVQANPMLALKLRPGILWPWNVGSIYVNRH